MTVRHGGNLVLVDLDRFKEVNDALGHPVGDDLLRVLGPRLAGRLRPGGTLARLGGDEFGVLVPGVADATKVLAAAERVAGALDTPIRVDGVDVHLSASIGIAVAPDHGADSATLLRKADVAMYEAKRLGTGSVLYTPTADRHPRERLQTATDLRSALDRGELVCYYQPQIDLATRRVTGMEALVRWLHPTRGVLVPDRFLALAESERVSRTLVSLRELGVAVSIDDYGVGYSSLSYLQKLPIDELKLDRALVTPVTRDVRAAAIVASTVDLAHTLGVRLVAEGVEDAATMEALRALGCDRAQGYHMARPMAADLVIGWTRSWAIAATPAHG